MMCNKVVFKRAEGSGTTVEVNGYGIYILWNHNTGGGTMFTFNYSVNQLKLIGEDNGNVFNLISKPSAGATVIITLGSSTYSLYRISFPE